MGGVASIAQKVLSVAGNVVQTAGPIIQKLQTITGQNDKKNEISNLKLCLYEVSLTKSLCNSAFSNHYVEGQQLDRAGVKIAIIYTIIQAIDNDLSLANLEMTYDSGRNVSGVTDDFYILIGYLKALRSLLITVLRADLTGYQVRFCLPNDITIKGVPNILFKTDVILSQFNGKNVYNNLLWSSSTEIYKLIVPSNTDVIEMFSLNDVGDTLSFPANAILEIEWCDGGNFEACVQILQGRSDVTPIINRIAQTITIDLKSISENIMTIDLTIGSKTYYLMNDSAINWTKDNVIFLSWLNGITGIMCKVKYYANKLIKNPDKHTNDEKKDNVQTQSIKSKD